MNIFEKKIIGGIIAGTIKPSELDLGTTDFEDLELSLCLTILRQIENEGLPIDAEILGQRLAKTDLGFYSARDFELMAAAARSSSVVYEAIEKIKGNSLKNFLLERAANVALGTAKSGTSLLDELKAIVANAEQFYKSSENNFVQIGELSEKVKQVYLDLHNDISYAVPTFFESVDNEILDGFSKSDLHIIAGFTGQGKSGLALNFAKAQAQKNIPVGIVSREMSDVENIIRLQSSDSKTPRWHIRKGMHRTDFDILTSHFESFSKLPIYLDVRTSDIETLRPQVKKMVEQFGLQILYVDYLQLMKSSKNATRADEVASVSRGLKEIAMENKIPVVALCQFNRAGSNAGLFDLMNYLKESSGIEQDASTILYIQVEKTEEKKQFKEAKITVLKNRNGATFANVPLTYRGEIFTFYEEGQAV